MSNYIHVKEWRKNTKQKLLEALGSCCQICFYNKSNSAMEFHHIDPSKKDFSIAQNMSKSVKAWDLLRIEASKCILLCANCHREVHDGTSKLPEKYQHFDELLISSGKEKPEDTPCLVCKKLKNYSQRYCSQKCAHINTAKINLTKEEVIDILIKNKGNLSKIARELNISDNGFKKKCIKLNINSKDYK